jgi:ParB family chromosome partitioning protein
MNAVTTPKPAPSSQPQRALEAADPTKNLILVPLSRLVLRPTGRNVRKTPRMSIPELAASIQRVGLLQNLIVIPAADGEHYEVVAGGRRLAALKLLAKKHRIAKDWEVPCLLVADGTARTASLTENVQREAMHPADQFEAFAALVAEGRPSRTLRRISVTPLVVQRRLKLANVSPRLMADYRADAVTLDQLMALPSPTTTPRRKPRSTMRRSGSAARPLARAPDRARNRRLPASAGALRRAGHLRAGRRWHPPRPVRGRRCGRVPDRCRVLERWRKKLAASPPRCAEGWAWVDATPG